MAINEISKDVVHFVLSHVQSVELLEVLLLLHDQRSRTWTGDSVAAELRIQPRSAASRLLALAALGIATSPRSNDGAFSFDIDCALSPTIDALAAAYRTHRFAVIGLIFSSPPSRSTT